MAKKRENLFWFHTAMKELKWNIFYGSDHRSAGVCATRFDSSSHQLIANNFSFPLAVSQSRWLIYNSLSLFLSPFPCRWSCHKHVSTENRCNKNRGHSYWRRNWSETTGELFDSCITGKYTIQYIQLSPYSIIFMVCYSGRWQCAAPLSNMQCIRAIIGPNGRRAHARWEIGKVTTILVSITPAQCALYDNDMYVYMYVCIAIWCELFYRALSQLAPPTASIKMM